MVDESKINAIINSLATIRVYGKSEYERLVATDAIEIIEALLVERKEYENCTKYLKNL